MYPNDLRVVYKPYIVHDVAIPAALASCAANKQGQFTKLEGLIWEKAFAQQDLSMERITQLASEAGLDMARFVADVESAPCQQWIEENQEMLSKVGTRATPTFYINGRHVAGAVPLPVFKAVIDEELAKANKAVAGGISRASYYEQAVVRAGKTSLDTAE